MKSVRTGFMEQLTPPFQRTLSQILCLSAQWKTQRLPEEGLETLAHTRTSHKRDSRSVVLQSHFKSLPGMTNAYNVTANLPHAPRIWMLFRQKSPHFSFRSPSVSKQFLLVPPPFSSRSETQATFLKKTHARPITSDSSPSPSPPPAALLRLSSPLQVTCTPSLPLSALSTPGRRRGYVFTRA